jgi:Protein of unknown function (DUF1572)
MAHERTDSYLHDSIALFRSYKQLAERAMAQCPEAALFTALDSESNSIAVIVKHMAGNMRSRWTDFLTTDGEKPNRERDREFIQEGRDTRDAIRADWEDGWDRVFKAIGSLSADDLRKTVRVRGEAHTVLEAINRQMTHYAQHVGQIVLLAKHYAGANWKSLSIPRGQSQKFDVSKSGQAYGI